MPLLATSGLISKTAGDIQAERDKARREQEAHAQTLAIHQYNLEQAREEAERIKALRAGLIAQANEPGRELGSIPGVSLTEGAPRAATATATATAPPTPPVDLGGSGAEGSVLAPRPRAAEIVPTDADISSAIEAERAAILAEKRKRTGRPFPTSRGYTIEALKEKRDSLIESLSYARKNLSEAIKRGDRPSHPSRRGREGRLQIDIEGLEAQLASVNNRLSEMLIARPSPEARSQAGLLGDEYAARPNGGLEAQQARSQAGLIGPTMPPPPGDWIHLNVARAKIFEHGESQNYTRRGQKLNPDTYFATAEALLDPDNNETFAREALSRMQNYFIRKGESETDAMRLAAQAWHQGFGNIDNAEAKKYGDSVMVRVAGGMSLLEAIAQEETRGEAHPDFAVNKHSGAIGRYQILPWYAHKFMVGDHTISISDFVGEEPAKEIGKPREQQIANARTYNINDTTAVKKYLGNRQFYSDMMKMAANTGNYELYHQISASRQALDQGVMGSVAAEYHKEKNYPALLGVLQDHMGESVQWKLLPDGKYRITTNGRELIEGTLTEVGRSARMLVDPMYYAQLTAVGTKRAENQAELMGELRKIAAEYRGKAAVQEIKSRMKASLVQGTGGEVWLLKGSELFRIDSEILADLGGVIGINVQPVRTNNG